MVDGFDQPEQDVASVLGHLWPYDRPHTPQRLQQAATALAVLTGYVANATGPANRDVSLPYAPTIYHLTGALRETLTGLHTVLQRLADRLMEQGDQARMGDGAGGLYDDRGDRSPATTAYRAAPHLHRAARAAIAADSELAQAHAATSHLGHHPGHTHGGER